ncbi:hypothetical protein HOY82DRAFT_538573 [Tuber indicum]|nr:hypothetical protein HOY82DRAFT_538573 [Tuber indicum]
MKDDMLYIAGGSMRYSLEEANRDGPSSYPDWVDIIIPLHRINDYKTFLDPVLRSLNVSKGFDTSLGSVSFIRTEGVPGTVPGVADAAFFPTESGLDLTFGMWRPYNSTIHGRGDAPIQGKKWQYEIATRQWTDKDIGLQNWFQSNTSRRVSSSMTAWIPSLKKGFLFGGTFVSVNETSLEVTELEEHNSLITYDQAADTWKNETTSFGGISEGGLVHIPTKTDDVLIQLGGRSKRSTRIRPFSEIRIYSTNQSKWYTQHLPSGALVPAPRFAFCTSLKNSSDGSSYQIYVMGGLEARTPVDVRGGATATSIWVLSIPSFEWVQLPVMSKTTAADPRARISPKCQAIGKHYIFYYGGRNAVDGFTTAICDKQANAAFLFDVNTLTWTDKFTPNEGTYEIPTEVVEVIGGSKTGGPTKNSPVHGWSDPSLKSIMTLNTTTQSYSHDPSDPQGGSKVWTIVSGVVGGTVVVALTFLGAMMLHRRRQKRRSQFPPNRIKPSTAHGGGLGEDGIPTELMEHNQVDRGGVLEEGGIPTELMEHNQVDRGGVLEEGGIPTELMEHSQVNGGGVCLVELSSGEVAREMDTGDGSGQDMMLP